ncbi:aspartate aminotransferase family protein [Candidatus Sumerlaeota bacterium]|nr:aspartate aminotransferase family protein [Candidatus Sumerlaeota bacterium]
MTNADLAQRAKEILVPTYSHTPPIALVRGKGARVWDVEGRQYLDFLAGIAVCGAGHCHPAIVEAIQRQAAELMHVSNIFLIPPQIEAAERLVALSFAEQAFFSNSGAEAVEGSLKLARRWQWANGHPDRTAIIAAQDSFHGRTYGAVTATGTPKYHEGFGPMLPGVRHAKFNDLASFEAELEKGDVAAVIVEPVQGEGGIIPATQKFLEGLRAACDRAGALLIYDEIQCGLGRTGKNCAYQHFGVAPDIMTHAKALGNGFPVGAFVTTKAIASVLTPGSHATTYGGNPLATAAAAAFLKLLVEENLAERAAKTGEFLMGLLRDELGDLPVVRGVRGLGLMIGIDTTTESAPIVPRCAERGLLLARAGKTVVRLVPPLIITEDDCREAVGILRNVLSEVKGD